MSLKRSKTKKDRKGVTMAYQRIAFFSHIDPDIAYLAHPAVA
jgi:hypothetical protein